MNLDLSPKRLHEAPEYLIHADGQLFSEKTNKFLRPRKDKQGYLAWMISHKNVHRMLSVHRTVAQYFINNPNNYPEVNHLDGNKSNNCVSNLEWCTSKQNKAHAWKNKLCTKPPQERIDVNQYSLSGEFIKTWHGIQAASKIFGVSHTAISNACRGKSKTCCGFIWRYSNNGFKPNSRKPSN